MVERDPVRARSPRPPERFHGFGEPRGRRITSFLLFRRRRLQRFQFLIPKLARRGEELFERNLAGVDLGQQRAVGLYAELINVNAYNQPGVEAGKLAAGTVLELQAMILAHLKATPASAQTVDEIAAAIGTPEAAERIYHILEHAAANTDHGIRRIAGTNPFNARYIQDSSQSSVLSNQMPLDH